MLFSELIKEQEEIFKTTNGYSEYQIKCIKMIKDVIETLEGLHGTKKSFSFVSVSEGASREILENCPTTYTYETFLREYNINHKILIYCSEKTFYEVCSKLTKYDLWKSYNHNCMMHKLTKLTLNPASSLEDEEPEIILVSNSYFNSEFKSSINKLTTDEKIFTCRILDDKSEDYFYLPNEESFSLPSVYFQEYFEDADELY